MDEIVFIAVGLGVLLRGPENLHVVAVVRATARVTVAGRIARTFG